MSSPFFYFFGAMMNIIFGEEEKEFFLLDFHSFDGEGIASFFQGVSSPVSDAERGNRLFVKWNQEEEEKIKMRGKNAALVKVEERK